MKKINQLAAAVAVALSMTATPQVSAEIEFHPDGRGDALLFPVFNGYIENYFTIMNNHNAWIQGHLRFRGAAWSGELLDFDVILSPGDVFVFRIADLDGDGYWEIDQSLDRRNFQYTGLNNYFATANGVQGTFSKCGPEGNSTPDIDECMDPKFLLVPEPDLVPPIIITEDIIEHHKHMGYVEFIGEAVLDGMSHQVMNILLQENPGNWKPHQTQAFSGRGTSAWAWSDAAGGFARDRGLSDVPNALSGTAFISIPGCEGIAYNAEALVNFRTSETAHRIDNYTRGTASDIVGHPNHFTDYNASKGDNYDTKQPITHSAGKTVVPFIQANEDRAVILHHEDGLSPAIGPSPVGDYVYQFQNPPVPGGPLEDRMDEALISFNNTWGPTLADGDDYNMWDLRNYTPKGSPFDDWDLDLGAVENQTNSIAEVEEAIRLGVSKKFPASPFEFGPQVFTSYYFDGDIFDKSCEGNQSSFPNAPDFCLQNRERQPSLYSYYFAFFPTKFYYGEDPVIFALSANRDTYVNLAVQKLLGLSKRVNLSVWDIFEHTGTPGSLSSSTSPSPPPAEVVPTGFNHELTFLGISDIKTLFSESVTREGQFASGRIVVEFPNNSPLLAEPTMNIRTDWPGLMYTFEWDGESALDHWRRMHTSFMHRLPPN